jgi:hypothetical protein
MTDKEEFLLKGAEKAIQTKINKSDKLLMILFLFALLFIYFEDSIL